MSDQPAVSALDLGLGRIQKVWWKRGGKRFLRIAERKPLGVFGGFLVLGLFTAAAFAEVIAPYGYNQTNIQDQMAGPSLAHWFGADEFGRDVFTRIVYGARISVTIGIGATMVAISLATILGMITGYYGGWLDNIIQRFVDAWMAFPNLVLLLAMVSLMGPGLWQLIIVIALSFGIRNSRLIRSQVFSILGRGYIDAARAIGASDRRLMFQHILPNSMAPIIILATIEVPAVILVEASLSFLGFGIPPPFPSWGGMLSSDARRAMMSAPWLAIAPGVALSLTVFGWNMMGDALRDLLDPALRGGK